MFKPYGLKCWGKREILVQSHPTQMIDVLHRTNSIYVSLHTNTQQNTRVNDNTERNLIRQRTLFSWIIYCKTNEIPVHLRNLNCSPRRPTKNFIRQIAYKAVSTKNRLKILHKLVIRYTVIKLELDLGQDNNDDDDRIQYESRLWTAHLEFVLKSIYLRLHVKDNVWSLISHNEQLLL